MRFRFPSWLVQRAASASWRVEWLCLRGNRTKRSASAEKVFVFLEHLAYFPPGPWRYSFSFNKLWSLSDAPTSSRQVRTLPTFSVFTNPLFSRSCKCCATAVRVIARGPANRDSSFVDKCLL